MIENEYADLGSVTREAGKFITEVEVT